MVNVAGILWAVWVVVSSARRRGTAVCCRRGNGVVTRKMERLIRSEGGFGDGHSGER